MKEMLNTTTKQGSHEIVGKVTKNNFDAQMDHSYHKVYVFSRNVASILWDILSAITFVITFAVGA